MTADTAFRLGRYPPQVVDGAATPVQREAQLRPRFVFAGRLPNGGERHGQAYILRLTSSNQKYRGFSLRSMSTTRGQV